MAKPTTNQRKAIRSAAAKKGWETRRLAERLRRSEENVRAYLAERTAVSMERALPPSLWQRIKGWFA